MTCAEWINRLKWASLDLATRSGRINATTALIACEAFMAGDGWDDPNHDDWIRLYQHYIRLAQSTGYH